MAEPNAIAQFGYDDTREQYIIVDKLSVAEGTTYLKKYFPELSDEDMKTQIFEKIGTNPITLRNLVRDKKESIDSFVQEKLSYARSDLSTYPFQSILKALKELPNPADGIDPSYFKNLEEGGVPLINERDVLMTTRYLSQLNAILYRMDTKRYHLISTAHQTDLSTPLEILTGKGFVK